MSVPGSVDMDAKEERSEILPLPPALKHLCSSLRGAGLSLKTVGSRAVKGREGKAW